MKRLVYNEALAKLSQLENLDCGTMKRSNMISSSVVIGAFAIKKSLCGVSCTTKEMNWVDCNESTAIRLPK